MLGKGGEEQAHANHPHMVRTTTTKVAPISVIARDSSDLQPHLSKKGPVQLLWFSPPPQIWQLKRVGLEAPSHSIPLPVGSAT